MTDKKCYVCGGKIIIYLDNVTQKMITWDGKEKELCDGCYKSYLSGIEIYQKNNPEWIRPKVKKDE